MITKIVQLGDSMIKSMTGYGRGEYSDDIRSITIEMKSVNHRYCDINVRLPYRYAFLEKDVIRVVKESLLRGKIDISIRFDIFGESESDIRLNKDLADKYYLALRELGSKYDLSDKNISLEMLAGMPDVIKSLPLATDKELVKNLIMKPLTDSLESMCLMRESEGKKLAIDIINRAEKIDSIRAEVEEISKDSTSKYQEKLKLRIEEFLKDSIEIPEDRIAVEAAILADKSDVTEEVVRLKSHVQQLINYVKSDEPALGKKIDFLVQEMNREANTIGSKANDDRVTGCVIDLKAEIEKIREQVQNIE